MVKALQQRRVMILTGALLLGFLVLGLRLVDLQVFRHEELAVKARDNTDRNILREPHRGDIRDARGNLLATSVAVKRICADPTLIGDQYLEMARVLSPLLNLQPGPLAERLKPRVTAMKANGEPVFDQYVVLKNKVLLEEWEQIQRALTNQSFGFDPGGLGKADRRRLQNLRTKAVFADDDQMRVYPNHSMAAHILGFVGPGADSSELAGKDGIELVLNSKLVGAGGWRETERDRRGRELVAFRKQNVEPRDGLNVVLTIDSVIQQIAEAELAEAVQRHAPVSASAVVLRPRTGEVLAMATLPNYDPNDPSRAPVDARRNRVISDTAEPGSTFKIVVVSGALNDGLVKAAELFDCENGCFVYAGRSLRDDHPHGILSAEQIITKSSNIGAAKIGLRLGASRLHEYIRDFGFGSRTGIPLPGEVNGIVHAPKTWDKLTITRIPMGHAIAVTPLQMVVAMSVIANEGWLMRPMLVDRLEDQGKNVVARYHPQRVRQVINETAARQMVAALKTVVSTEGTGQKAALEHFTVAGKTGTAQKAGPGGYLPGKYCASFIGFFPADRPELCIAVTLDEPRQGYYGGQTAAPIFKRIAERSANYLNIRPDIDDAAKPADALPGARSPSPINTAAILTQ